MPAPLFVVLACIPAAWLLLPSDMRVFAQGALATGAFSSNI